MTRLVADLFADIGNGLVAIGGHRPVALQTGDLVDEIGKQLGAIGRVHDFRMELHGIEFLGFIGDEGERSVRRCGNDFEAIRDRGDAVAMAHPDLVAGADGPDAVENRAVLVDLDEGAAEFAVMAGFNLAAQLFAHGLLAVADAEHRQAAVEHDLWRPRRADVERRGRAAGQDDRLRIEALEAFFRRLEGHDLAIDAGLAHAPCDQLGDLAAEIDDENGIGMDCRCHNALPWLGLCDGELRPSL